MDEIQTHVTSLSGALGLSVAKHVILDLSQGQESFTMVGAQIGNCKTPTFEKQTCKNLPKCETK